MIQFRQRIGNAEILVVILQNLRSGFERVAAHFCFAFGCDHTNLRGTNSRFDQIELARDKNIQITRHRRSRGKANLFSAIDFLLALDWHVRYGEPVFRHDCAQLKTRAKNRFIPAGEKPAGVSRLELRTEHDFPLASALLLITRVKKSLSLLIDFPREAKRECVVSRRKFRWQREGEQFVFLVDLNCRGGQHFAIERRLCDFELERIQHQLLHRAANAQLHRFRSGER